MNGKNHTEVQETELLNDGDKKQEEQRRLILNGSMKQTKESKSPLWDLPRNVGELATQANQVATMILNGQMDIEIARTYSSITKTVAQAKNMEVAKSRITKQAPNLEL